MWGFGGRYYWGRKERGKDEIKRIVVVFAWMSSEEKHLKNYVELYSSLGWNSLVCHSQFLNMWVPNLDYVSRFQLWLHQSCCLMFTFLGLTASDNWLKASALGWWRNLATLGGLWFVWDCNLWCFRIWKFWFYRHFLLFCCFLTASPC